MLEERAREAEKDVAHLSERLREANRNLEEEKRKNAVLTARIEVVMKQIAEGKSVSCDVLGEDLNADELKEVNISFRVATAAA